MKKFDYTIGEKVWVKDKGTFEVVGKGKLHNRPVVFVSDENFSTALPAYLKDVEPLITEVFAEGDLVKGVHTFEGKVIGFEQETNRVLCVGLAETGRTRYAYKYNELTIKKAAKDNLTPPEGVFYLEVGKKYQLTSNHGMTIVSVEEFPQTQESGLPILDLKDANGINTVALVLTQYEARPGTNIWAVDAGNLPACAVSYLG